APAQHPGAGDDGRRCAPFASRVEAPPAPPHQIACASRHRPFACSRKQLQVKMGRILGKRTLSDTSDAGTTGTRSTRPGANMGHYKSNLRDLEINLFEFFGRGEVLGQAPYEAVDADTAREM